MADVALLYFTYLARLRGVLHCEIACSSKGYMLSLWNCTGGVILTLEDEGKEAARIVYNGLRASFHSV